MNVDARLQNLAQRVMKMRKEKKLTQREMARRAGMSPRAYQAFEAAGHIPLKKFANVLMVLELENELDLLVKISPQYSSLDAFEKSPAASVGEMN